MGSIRKDSFGTRARVRAGGATFELFRLDALERAGVGAVSHLPFSLRVLLENLLRMEDGETVAAEDIRALLARGTASAGSADREIPFTPARVVLQDFTGVPVVVDLAALRDAMKRMGADPARINPLRPVDLVIDHSVQVDRFGSPAAFRDNTRIEFARNRERYVFLRWGQRAFRNFRVVPPGTGIVHQVNLEHLSQVVLTDEGSTVPLAFPDTVIGTDSHTTMINGLGVVGWGVGGIEAEAAMLGQPISMLTPDVVGFHLSGKLPEGATATDVVLTVTRILRQHGVVGKFVEFFGDGLSSLSLPDRATIANMSPEYGATIGFFPVDDETLRYLRFTGRPPATVALVEAYCKEQGLFRSEGDAAPDFSDIVELDLARVEPSLAGPKRPQDLVPLREAGASFRRLLTDRTPAARGDDRPGRLRDGSVVIAAITSCTNTSNPSVMLGAGLLAKKAVERGLRSSPWVKTSLAPGSRVVMDYLERAGLLAPLEALGFHLVGFGCTTCIGNSGPLPESVAQAIRDDDLIVAAVLSGNRNFEGRIHPQVQASYLASPPLVVAYALAGDMNLDLSRDPLGTGTGGRPVYLQDVWPTPDEVRDTLRTAIGEEMFRRRYAEVFDGDEAWRAIDVPGGETYAWDPASTYIKHPPYFESMAMDPAAPGDIRGARVLALLGDSVTTDHISPAGAIATDSPAGRYLLEHGVRPEDFNSYGSRRGNHEVMIRGTFANIRLRNRLAPDTEGGWTTHLPGGEQLSIYDAAVKYARESVPLLVIAGKEYGAGSSRDWAAKGARLLGVRAVIAESFERIHRSNLAGMGVLPLQFLAGDSAASLGLGGRETFSVTGIAGRLGPGLRLQVTAADDAGSTRTFETLGRLDTPREVEYYRHGGILPYVLRRLLSSA